LKFLSPFRIAAALLVLFCAGHTLGGMLSQKSLGLASDAVFEAMKRVHFEFNGADSTWYGFWFGFGLTVSAFLLLSAAVAFQLDRVPSDQWHWVSPIAWALVASHAANTFLAWKYFFAGPTLFGVLITVLLVAGSLRKSRSRQAGPAPLQSAR